MGAVQALTDLAFTSDSATLVCAGDGQIWRWTVATGRGTVHELGESSVDEAAVLSGDGRFPVSWRVKGPIELWDTATGRRTRRPARRSDIIFELTFDATGNRIAIGYQGGVQIYDLRADRKSTNEVAEPHELLFAFSPDGRTAAADVLAPMSPDQRSVSILDLPHGMRRRDLRGHEGRVQALAFSPDGRLLAAGAGSLDGKVRLWRFA